MNNLEDYLCSLELQYGFSISIAYSVLNDPAQPKFMRKADEIHPAASLAKLFILGALVDEIAHWRLQLSQQVYVSHFVLGSGLLKYISYPITLSLEFLVHLMMVYSDNSAANCLLDLVTMPRVNQFMHDLGAKHAQLDVPMMPSPAEATNSYNQTTAEDVLLAYRHLSSSPLAHVADSRQDSWKCLLTLLRHRPLNLPKYLAVSLSPLWNARLTKGLERGSVLLRKSASGSHVYHDSCLVQTPKGLAAIVLMIEGKQGQLNDHRSQEYREAKHCAGVVEDVFLIKT